MFALGLNQYIPCLLRYKANPVYSRYFTYFTLEPHFLNLLRKRICAFSKEWEHNCLLLLLNLNMNYKCLNHGLIIKPNIRPNYYYILLGILISLK